MTKFKEKVKKNDTVYHLVGSVIDEKTGETIYVTKHWSYNKMRWRYSVETETGMEIIWRDIPEKT